MVCFKVQTWTQTRTFWLTRISNKVSAAMQWKNRWSVTFLFTFMSQHGHHPIKPWFATWLMLKRNRPRFHTTAMDSIPITDMQMWKKGPCFKEAKEELCNKWLKFSLSFSSSTAQLAAALLMEQRLLQKCAQAVQKSAWLTRMCHSVAAGQCFILLAVAAPKPTPPRSSHCKLSL